MPAFLCFTMQIYVSLAFFTIGCSSSLSKCVSAQCSWITSLSFQIYYHSSTFAHLLWQCHYKHTLKHQFLAHSLFFFHWSYTSSLCLMQHTNFSSFIDLIPHLFDWCNTLTFLLSLILYLISLIDATHSLFFFHWSYTSSLCLMQHTHFSFFIDLIPHLFAWYNTLTFLLSLILYLISLLDAAHSLFFFHWSYT